MLTGAGGDSADVSRSHSTGRESTTPSSEDLLARGGRVAELPADILSVIAPGISVKFLEEILGHPNREWETYRESMAYQYLFSGSKLSALSTDKKQIDAVLVERTDGTKGPNFFFPKVGSIELDFRLGITTWSDVIEKFSPSAAHFTGTSRWRQLYASDYFGMDGQYLMFIAGIRCDMPRIEALKSGQEEGMDLTEESVRIGRGADKKIDYLALSGIQGNEVEEIVPTDFTCWQEEAQ
jgi:hypothetical protein